VKEGRVTIKPPAEGAIGAEFLDFDVKSATPETGAAIREQVYRHKLVVFRKQRLSRTEYVAFARILGEPQIYLQKNYHHPDHPEIFVSSNVPENGRKVGVSGTGRYWHSDYQFHTEPLPMTMLYPQVLPASARETYYIDMARAYETLPRALAAHVAGNRAVHDAKWRYKVTPSDVDRALIDILADVAKLVPPVSHPAVIEHPITGKRALYVSSGFTAGLEGLSEKANKEVMAQLFAFIERPQHVHVHRWQDGDILLWDNRTLIHRASDTPAGEQSSSYRIGIYDGLPFYSARPRAHEQEAV
jgi:(R)-3-[(carboxymethyl)amino]fatty acid dioxygenase/decarboxylase